EHDEMIREMRAARAEAAAPSPDAAAVIAAGPAATLDRPRTARSAPPAVHRQQTVKSDGSVADGHRRQTVESDGLVADGRRHQTVESAGLVADGHRQQTVK